MKLLYILNVANRVNNFSHSSMYAAQECKHEFHIAGNWGYTSEKDRQDDEEKYRINIHQIDFKRFPMSPGNKKACEQLVNLMKRENFKAVHCNTPIGGVLGRICAKKLGIKKVIYQVHGFHFYKGAPKLNWLLYYPIEKLLARYTDALITINTEDYEFAKKHLKLRNNGEIYYVPGVGINSSDYTPDENTREEKRNELGFKPDDFVMISAGELNENKNNSVIISALAKCENKNFHYVLCGIGPLEQQLKNQAQQLGVADRVHFLGYRTDMKELLCASDCFVMPSFREGLSRSIMEAMSTGLPCIVSKIRGNVDLVVEGKGGYLCEPTDADEFSKAISVLGQDAVLRKNIKEFNLEKIKEFDLGVVTERMKEIYSENFY